MSLLQALNVSAIYEGQTVPTLNDISLSLPEQNITVVLGPSGCGKTTLLNILAGYIKPSAGEVLMNGLAIKGPGKDRVVVFQDDALMPWFSVAQNIELGLKIQGIAKNKRVAIIEKMLQIVHLSASADSNIWSLSGGMRQRVGIARALAVDSDFLLLDEPFGALDAFTREQMQDLLLSIWQQTQKSFFIITHDIEEALILSSHLVLMAPYPGRIVDEFKLDYNLQRIAGKSLRQIKLDKQFIEWREYLFSRLVSQDSAQYEVSI